MTAILAAILVACCWGGNFSASKFAMLEFPPFLTILLRFMILVLLMAPFALREKLPRWRDMAFLAVSNIILHFMLIFWAMYQGLTITSAIVATQLGVPFSCMLAAVFFKDFLGPWRSLGLAVAFMGVVVVAGTPNAAAHGLPFMVAIGGAMAWASANIYLKHMKPVGVVTFLFWPALLALPVLGLMSALFEQHQWQLVQQAHVRSWLGVGYSVIFSSLVGYGLWNRLLTRYPLSQVVPYSLLAPIVGIACGVWLFHETLTVKIIAGSVLTMVGVAIITFRRPRLAELEKL